MYQPFDDDDCDLSDGHSGPAGAPDPEDAGSKSLWYAGLVEDPLEHPAFPDEEEASHLEESVLAPVGESGDFEDSKMESLDDR